MKRILLLTAVLLLTISALSFAQSTTANATANVTATLSITRLSDLTFGNVNQGQTVAVASNTANAASFQITGAASTGTTLTLTFPTNLISGSYTMPFTGAVPYYHTVAGAGGSTVFGGPPIYY